MLNVPVIDHWWQTETGWTIAGNPAGLGLLPVKLGSPAVPMPGYDVQVLDDAGHAVPAGTLGNIVVPMFADRSVMRTAGLLLVWSALTLLVFPLAASNIWAIAADVFLIGVGGALGTVLQTRLMDVAEDAQSLAASLNHSAFNTANALGPFLGGLAIAGGFGWTSPGWVGALLALAGLGVWAAACLSQRSADRKAAQLVGRACLETQGR